MPSLIGNHGDYVLPVFIDDHARSATDFEKLSTCFHKEYFPRAILSPVYLNGAKTSVFAASLEFLGF